MINSHNKLVEGQPGELGQAYDEPISDMSWALGMHEPSTSRFYQGWYGGRPIGRPPPEQETQHQKWSRNEWESLGDEDSLQDAIDYAISQQDGCGDPGYYDPMENYRLKGQGYTWEIFLRD